MIKEVRAESKMELLKEDDPRCKSIKEGECVITIAVCLLGGGITCDTKVNDIVLKGDLMPDVVRQIARMIHEKVKHENEIGDAYVRGMKDAQEKIKKAMDGSEPKPEAPATEPAPEAPKAE